jgi:4-amino-4-deoxy-L-arabinose transferase-like glycosyltransferase
VLTGLVTAFAWPNNYDVLNYHLARVAHWAQQGSVAHYPTHIMHQLYYPPWAGFAALHLTLLGGNERFANFVQWLSMIGSVIGVSLIARQLGASPRGQAFSALFCATLPMGILQATTVQNDYATTFWLVCLAASLLAWRARPRATAWVLAVGAGLGLAMLTKGTGYIFAAPLGLVFLVAARPFRWPGFFRHAALIGLVALALTTPHYLRNLAVFGSPFGLSYNSTNPPVDRTPYLANDEISLPVVASNLVRTVVFQLGTPFPSVNSVVERQISEGFSTFGIALDDPKSTFLNHTLKGGLGRVNENAAGNFVHALLIGLSIPALLASRRWRRDGAVWSAALALGLGLVLFSALLKFEPQKSRLLLPLLVLWSPLAGLAFERISWLLVLAGICLVSWSQPLLLNNPSHHLVGPDSVLWKSRLDQYFEPYPVEQGRSRRDWTSTAEFVRSRQCNQLGLLAEWYELEYLFWVLLPELWEPGGRIEHVDLQNQTQVLERSRSTFRPCAVVSGRLRAAETYQIAGLTYRRAWSGQRLVVFLPEERPPRRG